MNFQKNVRIVERASEETLTSWFLGAWAEESMSPLMLTPEPKTESQLQAIFDVAGRATQEKIKRAIIQAIMQWRKQAHGFEPLRRTLLLAAYVRAAAIVHLVHSLFQSERLDPLESEESFLVCETALSVASGFAPLEDTRVLFESLFFDDSFDPRFAAILALGLCECVRADYIKYLLRLVRLTTDRQDYFHMESIMEELIRIVTLPVVARTFTKVAHVDRELLYKTLFSRSWSPCNLIWERDDFQVELRGNPELGQHKVDIAPEDVGNRSALYQAKNLDIAQAGGTREFMQQRLAATS